MPRYGLLLLFIAGTAVAEHPQQPNRATQGSSAGADDLGTAAAEQVAAMWATDPFRPGYALGNHRVELSIPSNLVDAPLVQARVVWRRRPSRPLNHTTVVCGTPPLADGANITLLPNCTLLFGSTLDIGTVAFAPSGHRVVHVYYMPYTFSGGSGGYSIKFTRADPNPDAHPRRSLQPGQDTTPTHGAAPLARVTGFFARTEFDAWSSMENAASASEAAAFVKNATAGEGPPPFLLFTELRQRQVRMVDALPISWVARRNRTSLSDTVAPGEFYVFIVGVYATTGHDVTVTGYTVKPRRAASARADGPGLDAEKSQPVAVNCFNLEGNRFNGTRFTQTQTIVRRTVGALYFGVNTSGTAAGTSLEFSLAIHAKGIGGGPPTTASVMVALDAKGPGLPSHGDRESWRLARMRWLDSTDGRDDDVSLGYTPIAIQPPVALPVLDPTAPNAPTARTPPAGRLFEVGVLDRKLTFDGGTGLPTSLVSNGHEILAAPIRFIATTADGESAVCRAGADMTHASPQQHGQGRATWSVTTLCGASNLELSIIATLTYEGCLNLVATARGAAGEAIALVDLRLEVPYKLDQAVFSMGIGMISGYRPKATSWSWSQYGKSCTQPTDPTKGSPADIVPQVWLGTPDAGLRIALKGSDPEWDSPEDYPKLPNASGFANCKPLANTNASTARADCAGTISLRELPPTAARQGGARSSQREGARGGAAVMYTASLGAVTIAKGMSTALHFDLLVTPLKPVNLSQHFSTRYFHFGEQMPMPGSNLTLKESVEQMKQLGVTWVVIHQGSNLNPYINYPIREDLMGTPSLQTFVDLCHGAGLKVKLYFTTRELSNRCAELFALKSLPGHEVLYGDGSGSNGEGGGGSDDGGGAWLQEHLGGDYKVAWSTVGYPWLGGMKGVRADEAIADNGASRWDNYYVEANAYLLDTPGTDGLYLDAIAFDRTTMERIRKKMERKKGKGIRMDIHRSGGWYCHGPGYGTPSLRYMQHFAWTDSLWMGEGFDYWGSTPEWWLLETSGLPFGVTGDMIREGTTGGNARGQGCPDPNRWLGMVFGMGTRLGFGTPLGANVTSAPNVKEVVPVWRFWIEHGLSGSSMVGWWSEAPVVTTNDTDVKATVYVWPKPERRIVIALGNFGNTTKSVQLTLGPGAATLGDSLGNNAGGYRDGVGIAAEAEAIDAYQSAATFAKGISVPCDAKRGWLLLATVP